MLPIDRSLLLLLVDKMLSLRYTIVACGFWHRKVHHCYILVIETVYCVSFIHQVTLSEHSILSSTSQVQAEPVEGRRVSKVVKTTVVHGERMEKHLGDSSLATDLPSAKDDFEEV